MPENIHITYLNHRIDITNLPIILTYDDLKQQEKETEEPRGELEKKWINHNQINKLAKFNSEKHTDQDLIELFMYKIFTLIGIKSMPVALGYEKINDQIHRCCLADDIVKKELGNEMILLETAFYKQAEENQTLSYSMTLKESVTSVFDAFKNLPNITPETVEEVKIDYLNMLLSDFIFDNPDRHLFNFAVIYNQFTKLYRFSDLFDNGECFSSYTDQFYKYHAGFIQYHREEYINSLIANYYHLLLSLINRLNSILTLDNILAILSEPEFKELSNERKQYICETIQQNLTLMNKKVVEHYPDKVLLEV